MTQGKDNAPPPSPGTIRRSKRKPNTAFDAWLGRGLHQLFDQVANEPIPDELLKLIEDDKSGD